MRYRRQTVLQSLPKAVRLRFSSVGPADAIRRREETSALREEQGSDQPHKLVPPGALPGPATTVEQRSRESLVGDTGRRLACGRHDDGGIPPAGSNPALLTNFYGESSSAGLERAFHGLVMLPTFREAAGSNPVLPNIRPSSNQDSCRQRRGCRLNACWPSNFIGAGMLRREILRSGFSGRFSTMKHPAGQFEQWSISKSQSDASDVNGVGQPYVVSRERPGIGRPTRWSVAHSLCSLTTDGTAVGNGKPGQVPRESELLHSVSLCFEQCGVEQTPEALTTRAVEGATSPASVACLRNSQYRKTGHCSNLPQASQYGGRSQSRPFPARGRKVMESGWRHDAISNMRPAARARVEAPAKRRVLSKEERQ